jgi:hypothetical protein
MRPFIAAVNRCATPRQRQDRLCGAACLLSLGDGNCLLANGPLFSLRRDCHERRRVDGIEDIQAIHIDDATDDNWIAEI